jgi:hypothetical protein
MVENGGRFWFHSPETEKLEKLQKFSVKELDEEDMRHSQSVMAIGTITMTAARIKRS